jgi:glyoxylase-like metal-dependent hydrolase (beta-lactamase superfamily II)
MHGQIKKISIPNPYFEGSNNIYFIDDGALILIDTGIGTADAFSHLERAGSALGYDLREIAAILLTHKHADHFGLAHRLQSISGARVWVHQDDWEDVVRYTERREIVAQLYHQLMLGWGIPPAAIQALAFLRNRYDSLAQSVPAERLTDGQRLSLGRAQISVMHTPGHTQGSVCYVYERKIFTGDHFLLSYTPNIGATDLQRGQMLAKYLHSLEKLRSFTEAEALPGHGPPIAPIEERLQVILKHHQARRAKILEILTDHQPRTVYEIAAQLFGAMREHHLILGCGEVHAHLEALCDEGLVRETEGQRFVVRPGQTQGSAPT